MREADSPYEKISLDATRAIVAPMVATGASSTEILDVLEKVVLGVLLANERLNNVSRRASGDGLEMLARSVRRRLGAVDY